MVRVALCRVLIAASTSLSLLQFFYVSECVNISRYHCSYFYHFNIITYGHVRFLFTATYAFQITNSKYQIAPFVIVRIVNETEDWQALVSIYTNGSDESRKEFLQCYTYYVEDALLWLFFSLEKFGSILYKSMRTSVATKRGTGNG